MLLGSTRRGGRQTASAVVACVLLALGCSGSSTSTSTSTSTSMAGRGDTMTTGSEPLRRLEAAIHANGGPGIPDGGVLVEIESFFDGNTDDSSIAPNLVGDATNPVMHHPGL